MILSGKVCVITGGACGLGKAICLVFAAKGANIVVADVDLARATELARQIEAMGRQSMAVRMDVSRSREIEEALASVLKTFPRVDVWVNNAGIGSRAMLDEMTEDQWDKVIAVNLKGTFLCTSIIAKAMKKQGNGRIINMSSRAGKGGSYGHINYASSKAGIIGLTKSAARELGKYNITVNALLPGFIETGMTRSLSDSIKTPEQIVLTRPGTPEDVAYAAAFLASDEASWITGIGLEVTGGTGMFAG
ncbi:MAG: glucose 1-dehydrogenase [Deltaproteobacteria bacterium]|nr:glucose 1-dehydrogenase [Deltaproteobacteria bacterium]